MSHMTCVHMTELLWMIPSQLTFLALFSGDQVLETKVWVI